MNTRCHSADSSEDRSAFTLVELLVVVVVIAVLAALTFPVLHMVRKNGDRTAGLSNMRQIGAAFALYSTENDFQFPSQIGRAHV